MTQTRVSVQRATLKNYGDIILCNLNIKTDIISGKIYIYDDKLGFYNSENSLAILEREIIDLLDNEYTKNKVEQIVKYIKVKTQEDLKKNNKVNLVCLNNGIFDLNEGKLIEKNKEDFVSLRLNVKWEPNSSLNNCRYWNEYIESTVHPQDINKLQEGLGNIFEPSYITKKIFYLYGGPNSGKTTFILIIQDFLGKNNYTALDLKDIEQESYEIAELYEKRANFGPEIPYKLGFKNINIIKKLTGGDEFTARRIYDSPFKFNNVAKVFFSGNEIPRVYATDCDYAFFDRWEFIRFSFHFEKDNEFILTHTRPEVKSMIFNWMVEGYRRLRERKWVFTNQLPREEIVNAFKGGEVSGGSFMVWLNTRCYAVENDYTLILDLFNDCKEWHIENKLIPCVSDIRQFGKLLATQEKFKIMQCHPLVNGEQQLCYKGIKLKNKPFDIEL